MKFYALYIDLFSSTKNCPSISTSRQIRNRRDLYLINRNKTFSVILFFPVLCVFYNEIWIFYNAICKFLYNEMFKQQILLNKSVDFLR